MMESLAVRKVKKKHAKHLGLMRLALRARRTPPKEKSMRLTTSRHLV